MLIHEKILAILADSDAIGKDRTNSQQGFKFRGIDDVYNSLHPLLAKHGVFSTTQVLSDRTEERTTKNGGALIYRILTVKFTFYAADGSSVESTILGEGMDSGDKASNKALSIAHKYALLQLLAIPTEDAKDPDAETHYVEPKTEPPKLSAQNPIGKPPESAMKERSLAIIKQLALTPEDAEAVLEKHGGKKVGDGWQGIKWAEVLNDVNVRLAGKVGVAGLMPDDEKIPF